MRILNYQRPTERQDDARPLFRVLAGAFAACAFTVAIWFPYQHPSALDIVTGLFAIAWGALFLYLAVTGKWPWRLHSLRPKDQG